MLRWPHTKLRVAPRVTYNSEWFFPEKKIKVDILIISDGLIIIKFKALNDYEHVYIMNGLIYIGYV